VNSNNCSNSQACHCYCQERAPSTLFKDIFAYSDKYGAIGCTANSCNSVAKQDGWVPSACLGTDAGTMGIYYVPLTKYSLAIDITEAKFTCMNIPNQVYSVLFSCFTETGGQTTCSVNTYFSLTLYGAKDCAVRHAISLARAQIPCLACQGGTELASTINNPKAKNGYFSNQVCGLATQTGSSTTFISASLHELPLSAGARVAPAASLLLAASAALLIALSF